MKRIIKFWGIVLCLVALSLTFSACGDEEDDYTKLSFKSTLKYDYLSELNDEKVTINGYIATSSPPNGSFIFLMNMPYQSCPFSFERTKDWHYGLYC